MLHLFTRLADWLTYALLGFTPGAATGEAVHFFLEDIPKLFFLLSVMIYAIAFLRARVDNERMRQFLAGKNRLLCYLLAALLGAVTPFCSCSSIPLFLGFAAARLPLGIAMAFLITSPTVNEAAVVMLGGSIGWGLTALYVALGVGAGFLGGLFFDTLKAERWLALPEAPAPKPTLCACRCKCSAPPPLPSRHAFALQELRTILSAIARGWSWELAWGRPYTALCRRASWQHTWAAGSGGAFPWPLASASPPMSTPPPLFPSSPPLSTKVYPWEQPLPLCSRPPQPPCPSSSFSSE